MIVYLSIGKKYQWFTVHRLVAETFIPNPQNLSDVNHINGNKLDNRVVNLDGVYPFLQCETFIRCFKEKKKMLGNTL